MKRVLHILSQRPSLTGSGVTLDALVRNAAAAGWEQAVVVGVPVGERRPAVDELSSDKIFPLHFGQGTLPFPVPGMSDVMPYESTRFREMTPDQLDSYRAAWHSHLSQVIQRFNPDVIHAHHIWLLGSLVKDVANDLPVVSHCHATGLRQMKLCPHLAGEVRAGCRRIDRFLVLHRQHAAELALALDVPNGRIDVVGAGYRDDLFHGRQRRPEDGRGKLLYVGKYSSAKGLPWLLDAVTRLADSVPGLELHVAGDGSGEEANQLRARMSALAPAVTMHGQLSQEELARLMRRCSVCVLPSFFEGLPLVLVEALASGCRLVATRLPGVTEQLAPHLGDLIEIVPMPRLTDVDQPVAADLPRFVNDLTAALGKALAGEGLGDPSLRHGPIVRQFTWGAVFEKVEKCWITEIGRKKGSR